METLTITYELNRISVEVIVEDASKMGEKEILAVSEKALFKKLSEQLPLLKYKISRGKLIDEVNLLPGRPIRMIQSGTLGVIYDVKHKHKFPLKISLLKGEPIGCTKLDVKTVSKMINIDKLITGRSKNERLSGEWYSGNTAYLVKDEEIIPVVLNVGPKNIKAITISHNANGEFYTLKPEEQDRLFDTRKDAEMATF